MGRTGRDHPFYGWSRRLLKNPPGEEPRRVESSADDGRKGNSVISGDMRVGNDTSHDGQGDFSARIEPCPSCIPLSKKAKGLFRQAAGPPVLRVVPTSFTEAENGTCPAALRSTIPSVWLWRPYAPQHRGGPSAGRSLMETIQSPGMAVFGSGR